jgi:hypothetical protein
LLHKSFRVPKPPLRPSLDRDAIDELIYRTTVLRTRLLLDPQARCGLRIGEVLSLTVACGTGRDAKPGWDFRHGVVEAIRRQGPPIKWGGLIPGHFADDRAIGIDLLPPSLQTILDLLVHGLVYYQNVAVLYYWYINKI